MSETEKKIADWLFLNAYEYSDGQMGYLEIVQDIYQRLHHTVNEYSALEARAAELENLLDEYNQSVLTPDQRVEQLRLLIVSATRAEELEAERDMLKTMLDVDKDTMRQLIVEQGNHIAELERVLRMVEWFEDSQGDQICPWCEGVALFGDSHATDCPRQKMLGEGVKDE